MIWKSDDCKNCERLVAERDEWKASAIFYANKCDELRAAHAETQAELRRLAAQIADRNAAVDKLIEEQCTPADRKVLEAMAAASESELRHTLGYYTKLWHKHVAAAELAKRGEKP